LAPKVAYHEAATDTRIWRMIAIPSMCGIDTDMNLPMDEDG